MHWLLALVLFTSLSAADAAAAEPEAKNTMRHVRPQDARLTALLQEGMLRSRSLHALVDRIETSDVYVYIALDHLMKSYLAGRLTWMGQSNEFRYLRASINFDLSSDQVISTIAHELQHAVEVLDDQAVVDERSLVALYKRIGKPSRLELNSGWETDAAREMGYQVRRELIATPTASLRATIDRGKS
ncbi:MAG: hypothetical protein ABI665_13390 [Vicinamibacterales bacterium]